MRLPKETKARIVEKFGSSPADTGGVQAQAALLTEKIKSLTEHFKTHKKDFHSMRGLMKMVSRRKKLLSYLKKNEAGAYQSLIKDLGLRK